MQSCQVSDRSEAFHYRDFNGKMASYLEQHEAVIDVVSFIVGALICAAALFGNLLTIISLVKFKYLQLKSNILIFSLSVSDIFCVTSWLIKESINMTLKWCKFQPNYHIWIRMTNNTFFQSSVYHLVMISVERYITIFNGLRSEQLLNKKIFTLMLGFCWIFPIGLNMALTPWISNWNTENHTCEYAEIWRKMGFFTSINLYLVWEPIMLIVYFRIYKASNRQVNQIRALQVRAEKKRFNSKAIKTLSLLLVAFYMAWIPHFIVGAVKFFRPGIDKSLYMLVHHITIKVGLMNSAVNFFIYAYNNKDFKRAYKQLLCKSN